MREEYLCMDRWACGIVGEGGITQSAIGRHPATLTTDATD